MAIPTIRGSSAYFKVFQDGREIIMDAVQRVSLSQDSSFSRQFYVGRSDGEGDQTIEGYSGSIDMQVRDALVDDFLDELETANRNGIAIPNYTFITTENYTDGTTRSYVYYDIQFKFSRDQGGLQEKLTKRIDFQAAGRIRI